MALKVEISANITDERITAVLGSHVPIWMLSAREPGNDVMRHKRDLSELRQIVRGLYNDIKTQHEASERPFTCSPPSRFLQRSSWSSRKDAKNLTLPLLVYDNVQK